MSKMDILAAFEKLPRKPVTTGEILAVLPEGTPELTYHTSYLYLTLRRLVADGRLKKTGRYPNWRYEKSREVCGQ